MKPKYHIIIQLMLLCCVVCLTYSPAFLAEPCLLDDVAMLKGLQGDAHLDLKALLTPNSAQISYYRPFIGVSYWVSQTLWNAAPQAMHVENVIFHLLNVVLLFWLIRFSIQDRPHPNLPFMPQRVLEGEGTKITKSTFIPFLGALLFAVHPIATESVNWISGRSDLIAGAFLIGATIAIIAWQRKRGSWWLLFLSALLVVGAILTKEISWGFLVILPFFLSAPHDSHTYTLLDFIGVFSRLEKLLLLAAVASCFFLAAAFLSFWPVVAVSIILGLTVLYRKPSLRRLPIKVYILLFSLLIIAVALIPYGMKLAQKLSADAAYSNFNRTVLLISSDFDNSIGIFSSALAFYIKKFFLPLPLSFAIIDFAPEYLFAGIAVIILTAFLCAWHSQAAILFLTGVALIVPVLLLSHNQIAWAPYAERYIYISSAFWIAAIALALNSLKRPSVQTSCAFICLALVSLAAVISYKRSNVWQTNVTLFADTVQKSPDHIEARVLYMSALSKAGKLPEALEQYRRIQADPRSWLRIRYFIELAEHLIKAGLKQDAWEVLQTSLAKPLPQGRKHPQRNDYWQQLYKLHGELQQELFP